MVKVYKVELMVLDFGEQPQEQVVAQLEAQSYIISKVNKIESREITNWFDDHPLNKKDTAKACFEALFDPNSVKFGGYMMSTTLNDGEIRIIDTTGGVIDTTTITSDPNMMLGGKIVVDTVREYPVGSECGYWDRSKFVPLGVAVAKDSIQKSMAEMLRGLREDFGEKFKELRIGYAKEMGLLSEDLERIEKL